MHDHLVLVEGFVPTRGDRTNLRDEAWNFALDQRVFGPRKLLVAFASRNGRFRGLAYADRTDPPEVALRGCVEHVGRGAAAAVAFCDEPVTDGPPPEDLAQRFERASAAAAERGVRLVDWIACDDQLVRSTRLALHPGREWWAVT